MPRALFRLDNFAKMDYKMQPRGIFWTWCMNKICKLWVFDSIHMVRFAIAITNIFVWNLKLQIQNYFVIPLQIRYWQSVNENYYDRLTNI